VIMFELTGGLEYIVPIVIAIVCSKLVADAFGHGGLYAHLIRIHGFPHIDAKTDLDTEGLASDVMMADPVALTCYGHTLHSLRSILEQHSFHGFPIINNDIERIVYGFVSRNDLLDAIGRWFGERWK
jgi:chloride channel 3/4/5